MGLTTLSAVTAHEAVQVIHKFYGRPHRGVTPAWRKCATFGEIDCCVTVKSKITMHPYCIYGYPYENHNRSVGCTI